jgi:murein DD-endopeptidase MepM/ murein hydrolase activator NlpD
MDKQTKQAAIAVVGAFIIAKLLRITEKLTATQFKVMAALKQIPSPLQTATYVSSPYGQRVHPVTGVTHFHNGIDLPAPEGTVIYSPLAGVVSKNYNNSVGGNQLVIDSGAVTMGYAHLKTKSPLTVGTVVKKGQAIGEVGKTGRVTGAHLHFTVKLLGEFIDPATVIEL